MHQTLKDMNRQTLCKLLQPAIILLWAMACFCLFQSLHKYHFYYQEQTQLFLNSWSHVLTYLQGPAWLARLVGDGLTQFYYYTYAGPAILTLCLLTLGDVLRRALQKAGVRNWWAFLWAMMGMTLVASCCFSEQYRLSSVVALIGGTALFWLTPNPLSTKLSQQGLKHAGFCFRLSLLEPLLTLIAAALSWWLFGSGLLVYALLTLIATLLRRALWPRLVATVVVLMLIPATKRIYLMAYADLYTTPGLGRPHAPSMAIDRELAVITEYGLGNHNRVKKMVESEAAPTDGMKFYYWLVMAQRGMLPDQLLRWQWPGKSLGTFYQIASTTPTLVTYSLNDLYWTLGDMTYTERAAMLANVFAPNNRNVMMTKRLAEANLVTGERAAATKYLRLLRQTVAYRQWALRLLKGDKMALKPYADKGAMVCHTDTIQTGQNIHTVMMRLLDSNPSNTAALDYMLCSVLVLKDIETFKRDYDRYCMPPAQPRLKKLYQEALCIYLAGSNAPKEEWQKYIHDATVVSRFADYNAHRGSDAFRDTYWYYFDNAPQIRLTDPQ